MTVRIGRPAPLIPLRAMYALQGPMLQLKGLALGPTELAARHSALTRSFAAYAGKDCVACGGFYDAAPGRLDVWFACLPACADHMLSLVRQARLTCQVIGETEGVDLCARVIEGWRPGQRLAALLGFRLAGTSDGVETWIRERP